MKIQCGSTLAFASIFVLSVSVVSCTSLPMLDIGMSKDMGSMRVFGLLMNKLEMDGLLKEDALASFLANIQDTPRIPVNSDAKSEEIFMSKMAGISFGSAITTLMGLIEPEVLDLLTNSVLPQKVNEFPFLAPFIAPLSPKLDRLRSTPFQLKWENIDLLGGALPGFLSSKLTSSTTPRPDSCLVARVEVGNSMDTSIRNVAYKMLASKAVLFGLGRAVAELCNTNDPKCRYILKFQLNRLRGEGSLNVVYGAIVYNLANQQWQLVSAEPGSALSVLSSSATTAARTPIDTAFPWTGMSDLAGQTVQQIACIQ